LLVFLAGVLHAESTDGELRVFLILSQRAGPDMLNKIVGDIGATAPTVEAWGRKTTLVKKLPPESYTVVVKNVEACAFKKCVPCPDQTRDAAVRTGQSAEVVFRWNATYDRVEEKWTCAEK